jgi:RND family efflux transporter MFP subunit
MSPRQSMVGIGLAVLGAVALALVLSVAGGRQGRVPESAHVHRADVAASGTKKQLWTCGMHPQVIRDAPGLCPICHMKLTPLVADAGDAGAVTINPVVVQNMGLRVVQARTGAVARTIRATAYLDEAEPNVHDVNLRVSGWIEALHADTVGMHLEAGEPIFELYSPELQVAVEELIAARRMAGGDAGGVTLQARTALVQSTRRKLELWGLTASQIDRLAQFDKAPRSITFTSPRTGHLTEKLAVAGAAVKAGERVLRIVDHSTLWLDVQVHPQDLAIVRVGQTVTALVEGSESQRVEGVVIFVHPHVDVGTRTATVRARIPNADLRLRPGMYATAEIEGTTTADVLLVPREAVIDTGRRQLAFVAVGAGRFEPREITVGAAGDDGWVEIVRGVAVGERVVTSGQFLLDAESRIREAIQKHLSHGLLAEQP